MKGTLEKIYNSLGRLEEFLDLPEEAYHLHPHNVKLLGTITRLRKLLNTMETNDN